MLPPESSLKVACIALVALALCAALAAPVNAESELGPRPPDNPWLGLDSASTIHNDGSASDTTDLEGPGVGAIQSDFQVLAGNCAVALILQEGNPVVMCFEPATSTPRVRILDKDDVSIVLSSLPLQGLTPLASSYAYLTNDDHFVVAGGPDSLLIVQTKNNDGDWDLQIVDTIDLSGHVPAGHDIIAMNPTADGAIWVVTSLGAVVRHDPDTGETTSVSLEPGERIANSLSSSGDGKVAVASDTALYLFKFAGKIRTLWREEYDRGSARKPGKLSQGSGSSPTFFGPKKGNEYVTIADNHDDGDRVLIFEAKNKQDPFVCMVEPPGDATFGSENSPIGIGNSVVYASTYGYFFPIPLPPSVPPTAPLQGGMFRADIIDAKRNECEVVWENPVVRNAAVPKLSVSDELIYTFERIDGEDGSETYLYAAIDFHTGEILKSQVVGFGPAFNTLQLAGNIGFDRALYQGTTFGLLKVQPAP